MAEALHTPRLRLDPWGEEHLAVLARLAATPAVVRYIGDGRAWSPARIHAVADNNAKHWRRHGFGWRVAVLTAGAGAAAGAEAGDGAPRAVGLIALNFAGEGAGVDPSEYEIGWWLEPAVWGRGLAREAGRALRDEAFTRVGAPSIVARIQPGNGASLGVAAALGLRHETDSTGRAGEPLSVLRLAADEWRALAGV